MKENSEAGKIVRDWLKRNQYSELYIKNIFVDTRLSIPMILSAMSGECEIPKTILREERKCRSCGNLIDQAYLSDDGLGVVWLKGICKKCSYRSNRDLSFQLQDERIEDAGIPAEYYFASIKELTSKRLDMFDSSNIKKHIWVSGKNRTGKTYCAIAYLKDLAYNYPIKFVSFFKMFRSDIRETEQIIEQIMEFKGVVLIDNIKALSSQYWLNKLENIICSRYDDALPTIFTTNIPVQEFSQVFGQTISSRIEEGGSVLEFENLTVKAK